MYKARGVAVDVLPKRSGAAWVRVVARFARGSQRSASPTFVDGGQRSTRPTADGVLQLQILIRHRAFGRAGYVAGIFCEDAAGVTRFGRFPGFATLFQFRGGDVQVELAFFGINRDR